MNDATLSRVCRRYVVAVGWAGMVPLAWAVGSLIAQPPHQAWYLLAGLTLLSGPLCIRIPSMQATISVSEGFIFTAALLFGPAAATATAVIDGLAVAMWSTRRTLIRTLFGVAEPAISVCAASLLLYELSGVPPLLHHAAPLGPLVLPLVAMSAVYFTLNTLLAGVAVWLETGGPPLVLLRQHLPHVAIDFSVSLALAAALVQANGNLTISALVVLVPMLLASYISSHHVAGRLEDTNRHLSELRRLYDSTVETLAMAIDAKDQVTHGHVRRVQQLSVRVAQVLGAGPRDLQALEAAALLHDLGKLAVPEHILNKPGPLSPAEYDEMKKHADVGASILSSIEFPFPVVPIVRHHHESWDGSGYPDGLAGTDIPLGARILAVVDCYDALTSHRPYRRRLSHDDAMEIIRSRSGRIYDPQVVDAFVAVHTSDDERTAAVGVAPSPVRAVRSAARPASPVMRPAPPGPVRERRDRVARFLTSIEGSDWQEAGRAVATFVAAAVPDTVACVFLFDPARHQLVAAGMHRGFDARVPDAIRMGEGVTGWVAANRQAMINSDAELDLGDAAGLAQPPLRLCMSVPIVDGGELAAVLTVYSPYAFTERDRLVIDALSEGLPASVRDDIGDRARGPLMVH